MTELESLLQKSDRQLKMICSEATHQHFKGGLYKYIGPVKNADTGELLWAPDGDHYEGYLHVYPHKRQLWIRRSQEWSGKNRHGQPRFRKLS